MFDQSNQFGHGVRFHLLHHVGAMKFDRLLSGAEVAGNLFVQFASNDIFKHFAFTWCKRVQARTDFCKFGMLLPKRAVFLNGHTNGCKQVFIVHRLGEEITGALFHCLDALWNISRTGQKNNGQDTACLGENALEFKTIEARHSEIEHRQPSVCGSYCAKNSSGDANAATTNPAERNRREMDLRTGA